LATSHVKQQPLCRQIRSNGFMNSYKRSAWRLKGLGSDGPYPEFKDKLMLFGQFVGDWDIASVKTPNPSGVAFRAGGEVHFNWILDGRAVQDVWMSYDAQSKGAFPVGTTIRVYDPSMDAWQSTWISAISRTVQTFIARQVGKEIILESQTKKDLPERWIFSDITPESFRWHSEESSDGGKLWALTEEMDIRRHR
jgi:hypothetical protein